MTIFEDVSGEFNAALKTALSLASTSPNYRDIRAGRLDWRGLIAQWQATGNSGLQPPYVVTVFGEMIPAPEWSAMDNQYKWLPVTVYYIAHAGVPIETIDAKMQAVHAAFDETSEFTTFQVVEAGSINNTSSNPANAYFLEASSQLVAGMFTISLLCEEL